MAQEAVKISPILLAGIGGVDFGVLVIEAKRRE
jgi:hypothetical protein